MIFLTKRLFLEWIGSAMAQGKFHQFNARKGRVLNFVTDFGAPTDGTSDSSPALNRWLAAAQPTDTLYIPAFNGVGNTSTYHLASSNGFTNGLGNVTITADSGASVDSLFIGNANMMAQDWAHSARVASLSVGATSATVITGPYPNDVNTDGSIFSVGQWVMFSGLSLQVAGFPPNFKYNEFRKLTSASGTSIGWSGPLANAYSQTWPLADVVPVTVTSANPAVVTWTKHGFSAGNPVLFTHDVGGSLPGGVSANTTYFVLAAGLTTNTFQFSTSAGGTAVATSSTGTSVLGHQTGMDIGGPATVYALAASFDANQTYNGLTCTQSTGVVTNIGKSLTLNNMKFTGNGPSPSLGQTCVISNTDFGSQNEIDKCIENLTYSGCTPTVGLKQLLIQSPGPQQLTINTCTFTTLNGTAENTTISNSTISAVDCAPVSFGGASNSITVTGSTITTGATTVPAMSLTSVDWTFSGGTFSFAVSDSAMKNLALQCMVPGYKYVYAYYDGSLHTVDDSSNTTVFSVTSINQDNTPNINIVTNLASLPTSTFLGGHAGNVYAHYGAITITQSTSGPADLTLQAQP